MKQLLLHISHIKKFFHTSNCPHPTRDWFVMLTITAVLVGGVVGWHAWVYLTATTKPATVREVSVIPEFDTSVVDAVEKAFVIRAEEAERYRSTYRFVDPSR